MYKADEYNTYVLVRSRFEFHQDARARGHHRHESEHDHQSREELPFWNTHFKSRLNT